MNAPALRSQASDLLALARFVDDRPEDRVFELDRRIFTDPKVFDAELRYIFEATWNFIGLESQIARPNDFITTHIGRHPILVMRGADGKVGAFLNTCRHRGAPIVVMGYLLVIFESRLVGAAGNIVLDTTGWVLVWVGIWFPLDTFFFSPLGYGRENHALKHLRDAEISVTTWRPTAG